MNKTLEYVKDKLDRAENYYHELFDRQKEAQRKLEEANKELIHINSYLTYARKEYDEFQEMYDELTSKEGK